jgi:hypothetical protein
MAFGLHNLEHIAGLEELQFDSHAFPFGRQFEDRAAVSPPYSIT